MTRSTLEALQHGEEDTTGVASGIDALGNNEGMSSAITSRGTIETYSGEALTVAEFSPKTADNVSRVLGYTREHDQKFQAFMKRATAGDIHLGTMDSPVEAVQAEPKETLVVQEVLPAALVFPQKKTGALRRFLTKIGW